MLDVFLFRRNGRVDVAAASRQFDAAVPVAPIVPRRASCAFGSDVRFRLPERGPCDQTVLGTRSSRVQSVVVFSGARSPSSLLAVGRLESKAEHRLS